MITISDEVYEDQMLAAIFSDFKKKVKAQKQQKAKFAEKKLNKGKTLHDFFYLFNPRNY